MFTGIVAASQFGPNPLNLLNLLNLLNRIWPPQLANPRNVLNLDDGVG
jgi:hypothetical protein